MKAFGVIGFKSERLVELLTDQFDSIAVVHYRPGDSGGIYEGPRKFEETSYNLYEKGWIAAGEELMLDDVLNRLSPHHSYVVVKGAPEADIPQIVLGREYDGDVLYKASGLEAVNLDEILERVFDLEDRETLESLVTQIKQSPYADRAGAIATFTGRVRGRDSENDAFTEYLEFEKHESVAPEKMRTIEEELKAREGVYEVALHHRTGVLRTGEDIVFVVVLAGHREEAFRTVEDGINRLKDEVPIFKKEVTTDEEFWVHERI